MSKESEKSKNDKTPREIMPKLKLHLQELEPNMKDEVWPFPKEVK